MTTATPPAKSPEKLGSQSASTFPATELDIFPYRNMIARMARSATTADAFNAVAEPRRRQILDLLSRGETSVGAVVEALGLSQPQVSKHLGVLRKVGLVSVRGSGRRRLYRLNAERLKPIHDWVKSFEQFWNESFDRLDEYLRELRIAQRADHPLTIPKGADHPLRIPKGADHKLRIPKGADHKQKEKKHGGGK